MAATIAGRFCNDRSGYLYAARRPGLALNFRGAMKVKREKAQIMKHERPGFTILTRLPAFV